MPLYWGATSRAILAHLDPRRIDALLKHDARGLKKAGFAGTAGELTAQLSELRKQVVFRSDGEVDPDATGWAVALLHGHQLLGSLSVVVQRAQIAGKEGAIADQLRRAALRIEGRLD